MRYDLIKTDNYLLICNDSEIKGYYYDDYIKKVRHSGGAEYVENNITKNIVAHLPLNGAPYLDGVPLLPSIPKHYDIDFAEVFYDLLKMTYPTFVEWPEAIEYNKQVREKYKFTEEDLRKAIKMAQEQELVRHTDSEYRMVIAYTHSEMDIIKSLQQPKYPIAFECEVEPEYKHIGAVKEVKGSGDKIRNKNAGKTKTIINPDGRVVWVGKYIYE
jgi:hypothetical protein